MQPSAPASDSSEDERENRNTGVGLRLALCTTVAAAEATRLDWFLIGTFRGESELTCVRSR